MTNTTTTTTPKTTLKRIATAALAAVVALSLAPIAPSNEAHATTLSATSVATQDVTAVTTDTAKTKLVAKNVTASKLIYTGRALAPKVTVKVAGKTLKKDRDYTLTIKTSKNKKVSANKPKAKGTYKAIVKGKGAYRGTVTKTFKVAAPKKLTASMITVRNVPRAMGYANPAAVLAEHKRYSYNYDEKNGWKGQSVVDYVTVRDGSKTLEYGTDYDLRVAFPEKYNWTQFHDKKTGDPVPGREATTGHCLVWEPDKYVVYVMGKGAYSGTICKYITVKAKTKKVKGVTYTQQHWEAYVGVGTPYKRRCPFTGKYFTLYHEYKWIRKTRWVKYDPVKETQQRLRQTTEMNKSAKGRIWLLNALPLVAVSK